MAAVRPEVRRQTPDSPRSYGGFHGAPQSGSQGGPRRYAAVHMEAVAPPSGRMLDDELAFDLDLALGEARALELDGRSSGSRATPGEMLLPPAPPAAVAAPPPGRRSSGTLAAVDPHAAFVAFAGFGDPPSSLWGAPAYALRVIVRRRSLRGDLALARRRRSADVGLYEASLRSADDAAVRSGITLTVGLLVIATALVAATVYLASGVLDVPW